jgi:hypothetical protein
MKRKERKGSSTTNFVVWLTVLTVAAAVPALAVEHAIEGAITHVDSATKKVAVKTADGTEEVFHYSGKTAVHAAKGAKVGAADTYLAGKEGAHVVIRYTGEGADKTAVAIDDLGKDTIKVDKGVVKGVDHSAHTVTVATEDGSEHVYHLGKDTVVDGEHGTVRGTEYVAKEGEQVSVHYTEEAGKKLVHFVKLL